jgi:hypothetical protein
VWWSHYWAQVSKEFAGEFWTVSEGARDQYGLNWIQGHPSAGGLSKSPNLINCGKNSGYQTLGLMHHFGVGRIVLVGFDMHPTNGRAHWHGDHPGKLSNTGPLRYPHWRNEMAPLAADLERAGVTVVNASRKTALKCFPRVTLEDALQ